MSGYNIGFNPVNFSEKTIYGQVAPNSIFNDIVVEGDFKSVITDKLTDPTCGQLLSITKVGTITQGSIQTPVAGLNNLNGPAQDVDVYKVIFYSTTADDNATVQVSGTLSVPKTITKTSILSNRPGAAYQIQDEFTSLWQCLESGTWAGLTPQQRADVGSSAPTLAGLGYIVVQADPFGIGINQGKAKLLDYFPEVYPMVDCLRAVRPVLPEYGFKGSIDPVNVIQYGYSNGGVYGLAAINELQPGVNPNITTSEAQKFNFTKGIFGATTNAYAIFDGYLSFYNNGGGASPTSTGTQAPFEVAGLSSFYFNNSKNTRDCLRSSWASQVSNIFDGDWFNTSAITNAKFATQINLNTVTYPPTSFGGTDGQYTIVPACFPGFFDTRQAINYSKLQTQVYNFLQCHGWTNMYRPLNTLPAGLKVSMIYSSVDQVTCPANTTVTYQAGSGIDATSALDAYMGAGPTYTGILGSQSYPGAGRNIVADNSQSVASASARLVIANAIKGQSAANYHRFRIEPSGLPGYPTPSAYLASGSHGGFSPYFADIVVSILA
jgi:hypothetical protein